MRHHRTVIDSHITWFAGGAHGFMLLLALKTVISASEILLSLSGSKTFCNGFSLHLCTLEFLILEPAIELPIYAVLYHSSYCEFTGPLLKRLEAQAKIWISFIHIFVALLRWAVQLRYWYKNSTTTDSRKWTIFLYLLGIFFSTFWVVSFRLWYFERTYGFHQHCYDT